MKPLCDGSKQVFETTSTNWLLLVTVVTFCSCHLAPKVDILKEASGQFPDVFVF